MLETKTKPKEKFENIIEYKEEEDNIKKTHVVNNKARKRPELLTVIVVLGILGSIFTVSSALNNINNNPLGLLALFLGIFGFVVLTGLYYGRYWAWVGIQMLWIVKCVIYEADVFSSELSISEIFIHTAIMSIIVGLLWIYIYTKRVRKFCSL